MLSPASRSRTAVNIWPGFVDVLASVLMVFIFMLLIFVVAQFFLADLASNRFGAIDQLSNNIHALLGELSLEKDRRDTMEKDMNALRRAREELQQRVATLVDKDAAREQDMRVLAQRGTQLTAQLSEESRRARFAEEGLQQQSRQIQELDNRVNEKDTSLSEVLRLNVDATAQVEQLNQQLYDLRQRIGTLASALEVSERTNSNYKIEVDDLGKKLNIALAERVEELSRYRSDFFGRMRKILGDRDDIKISGDRFVFSSELLFASGSAQLEPGGQRQLDQLAKTLTSVAEQIPADVDWVLRVDGHTDRQPIRTAGFPSNWELSSARALSIVRYLIKRDIAPRRLVAAGFGEFRPLDPADSPQAYARNRRIEIKFTGP